MANMIELETVKGEKVQFWINRAGPEIRMLIRFPERDHEVEFKSGEASELSDYLPIGILRAETGVI